MSDAVGLIGLGAMGSKIGAALLDGGYETVVFDSRADAIDALSGAGAEPAGSARDVADRAATVIVSLPTPDVVRDVAVGANGLGEGSAISTFIDLSTSGPLAAAELAAELSQRSINYLDAPLTGGVAGATARTLTVLASGERAVFDRCLPLLETFGGEILHVGPEPGQGQFAKLLNNLLSATAMAITSEALTLGMRGGLEPESMLAAFNAGSGRNTATAQKFPRFVLDRSFDSGFRLDLMLKDVRLCVGEARRRGLPLFVGSAVEQIWSLASQAADEEADHTEIVRLFEGWTGVEVAAGVGHESA